VAPSAVAASPRPQTVGKARAMPATPTQND
jgi:hypothetical protein